MAGLALSALGLWRRSRRRLKTVAIFMIPLALGFGLVHGGVVGANGTQGAELAVAQVQLLRQLRGIGCDGEVAVVTNGSHTDPIAEKMAAGVPARDALVQSMLALDYEKDDYSTPRISVVVDKVDSSGWLGVVRYDGLEVRRMPLEPGRFFYVATYEENSPKDEFGGVFPEKSAEDACGFILGKGVFAERTNPVTAVAAMSTDMGFEIHVQNAATE